jgi:GDPmannose 4,6-dehydratase
LGLSKELRLGNLDARRDWGHAEDYIRAMWAMLQQERADDYVIASEETHSVRDFLIQAFGLFDLDYQEYVTTDAKLFRPAEVAVLLGDTSKAKSRLGWQYERTFEGLVTEMVEHDLELEARIGGSSTQAGS